MCGQVSGCRPCNQKEPCSRCAKSRASAPIAVLAAASISASAAIGSSASEGDKENPVNRGSLCVKGRFGYSFINHPERLTTPLVKKDGKLVEATWDEALDRIAEKFSAAQGRSVRIARLSAYNQ